jgi:hypothetical protein
MDAIWGANALNAIAVSVTRRRRDGARPAALELTGNSLAAKSNLLPLALAPSVSRSSGAVVARDPAAAPDGTAAVGWLRQACEGRRPEIPQQQVAKLLFKTGLTSLLAQVLFATLPGCAPTPPQARMTAPANQAYATVGRFGDESDRHFNFGQVLADPSRELSHTFTLQNQTGKVVTIGRVVNGMPCCGEVEPVQAREVRPGASLSVTVKVRAQSVGPLRHWTSLVTDDPDADEIILDAVALVHAPLRIEALDENALVVAPGHGFARRFELIECLNISEPTNSQEKARWSISLPDRTAKVQWEASPHERPLSIELKERIHPFSVALSAGELSGADGTSLVVSDGTEPKLTYQLRWNVAAAIKAYPTLLRFSGRSSEAYTLTLSCMEGRPFKIVRITCDLPGVGVSMREESGSRHVLDVAFKAGAVEHRTRTGEIAIETDLAAQKRVRVPVLLVSETVKP